jgi:zeaxanthin glucosyltransferase
MDAAGVTYADVVLGHPSALPVDGELYGFPPAWPAAFTPDAAAVARLWELCARVDASFTAEWNAALAELNPAAAPSVSAFAEHGRTLLFNYPAALSTPRDGAVFLGSAIREEAPDADVDAWLASNDEPFVYVSFGSFLSVRADVLQRVADALAAVGVRAAIATGESTLERIPAGWLVRGFLPQVRLMSRAAVAVTHGGNNSVTEALTFGLPLLVLPFSTDQFAGAAAIEKAGYGLALAPNDASVDELAEAMRDLIARAPMPTAQTAGPAIAYSAVAYSAVAGSSASTP